MTPAGHSPDHGSVRGPGPGRNGDPGPGLEGTPGGPADPRLARLLRWYPPTWRKRYGDEFLAMVEDSLDGRRPGWRLRLGVAWSGLRERGHVLSGPAGKRARSRLGTFVMIGCLLAGSIGNAGGNPTAAGTWQATAAMTALAILAAITGAAIVAAVAVAWRFLVRFLRAGGWPKVRRRIISAAAATAAAAGMLTWLAALQTSMTPGQLATSQTYGIVFIVLTLLFVAAIGLWATAARAVARHLDLAPRIRAAETLLAAVIWAGVMTMVPVEIVWFGVIQSSVYWQTGGLLTLISSLFTVPSTLCQARRRAGRQRAAAARGRAG